MPRTRFEMVADDGAAPRDALLRDLDQSNTAYTSLKLPAPVFYQPLNGDHAGGIISGRFESVTIEAGGRARAAGVFYDGEDDQREAPRIWEMAREAVHMAREGAVYPSIDPTVLAVGPNAEGEPALTVADFSGVTLVGMPAKVGTYVTFPDDEVEVDDDAPAPTAAEVRHMADDDDDDLIDAVYGGDEGPGALIAAVRATGWDDLPLAPREREWDGAAAAQRLGADCGVDDEDASAAADAWSCYAGGFLYADPDANAQTRGAYKMGIVDVIDGERTIVPRAVFAVAAVLGGARDGTNIPAPEQARIRTVVAALYGRMADEFDDDGLAPPWEGAESSLRALIAAVVEAPPAEAFGRPDIPPGFDGYRIEGNRIYGNLYPVGACHLNWRDQCVMAPESASGYTLFRRYSVTTDRGDIPVGRLTTGLGRLGNGCDCCDPSVIDDHACPNTKGLIAAMSHHDLMPTLADVNVGEHEGAIWVAGILRPRLPAGAGEVLSRRVWSGDWRPSGEGDELVEVLALHHGEPGFTTRVQHTRGRGVLIASTGPTPAPPVDPEPVDVPALVARTVHALAAVQTMNTAVADAAQARARAELTRLERTL
jgi:hypothetical protein